MPMKLPHVRIFPGKTGGHRGTAPEGAAFISTTGAPPAAPHSPAGDEPIARRYSRPQQQRGPRTRINDQIRADRVRVVDPEGEHGIYEIDKALELAQRRGLDLVEVAADADPPVVKIMDFGKFRYEQQKKEKEQRKKAHKVELKEVRFRPNTDDHDFDFKTKHAREFLEEGNQVKAWVQFRGRDIIYKDRGADLLGRFIETLSDISRVEQLPQMEGRRMTVMLTPDKSGKKKQS